MLETYKGYTIQVEQDMYPENPREAWDNFGKMVCSHKRYSLGDVEISKQMPFDECNSWVEIEEYITKNFDPAVILPLFVYDHSGLSMRTFRHGYHSAWDCGQVGFIYVSKEDVRKEWNVNRISSKLLENVTNLLEGEVEAYSQYLEGDVYVVSLYEGEFEDEGDLEESIDCMGGCYGYEETLKEAKSQIDFYVKQAEAEAWRKIAEYDKEVIG